MPYKWSLLHILERLTIKYTVPVADTELRLLRNRLGGILINTTTSTSFSFSLYSQTDGKVVCLGRRMALKSELAGKSYLKQATPLPRRQYLPMNDVVSEEIRYKSRRCEDRKQSSISLIIGLFKVMQLQGALYGCFLKSSTSSLLVARYWKAHNRQ